MNRILRNLIIFMCAFLFAGTTAFCIELDTSIDKEINKKYNANSLEDSLPELPKDIEPDSVKNYSSEQTQSMQNIPADNFTTIKVGRGTKFRTVSRTGVSDTSIVGNKVIFVTTKPVNKRYITIPANSVIRGKIVDSHTPQLGGNGGLVKIEVESITINNALHYADGKITKANGKKIFLNNIKGKRKYAKAVKTSISKSNTFFKKAMRETSKLASDNLTVLLSPFTFIGGTIIYVGRVAIS
ncbi:hypothetical protein J6S88_02340, partial [bacterium]|nr:hypothetical protein [bacterium]